jgi:hypothetical protein
MKATQKKQVWEYIWAYKTRDMNQLREWERQIPMADAGTHARALAREGKLTRRWLNPEERRLRGYNTKVMLFEAVGETYWDKHADEIRSNKNGQ